MRVVTLLGGRKICVDRTEVTTAQYATFRTRALGLSPMEHTALETKVPAACALLAAVALSNAGGPDALPQVNVSFCSAAFYCAAQGKRLCGNAVDGAGIVITDGGTSPPLEWTLACANGKTENYFPWGSVDQSVAKSAGCLTQSTSPGAKAPRDAGAASACGPGDGLGPYDMIGNVWEWVTLRSDVDGGASYTGQLGGSFVGATVDGCMGMTGADAVHGEYANGNSQTGFRCCGDAP